MKKTRRIFKENKPFRDFICVFTKRSKAIEPIMVKYIPGVVGVDNNICEIK